jgi:ribosome maturation factor RimP
VEIEKEELETLVRSWFSEGLIDVVELLEVKVKGIAAKQRLVVVVDRTGGVTLDGLAEVSRELEDLLDRKEALSGRYVLEVTSPGEKWPLSSRADFQRNQGRLLEVVCRRSPDDETESTLRGIVSRVDDTVLELTSEDGRSLEIGLDSIITAKKIFGFPKDKPGEGRRNEAGLKGTGSPRAT